MRKVTIICSTVVAALGAMAESVSTNGYTWTYSVADGKATITGVSPQPTGTLNIPSVVAEYEVEVIGGNAFYGCNSITKAIIPNGVKHIGDYAFHCENLESIELPSSLKTIGNSAFDRCFKLKDIIVPPEVTSIGDYAFDCCGAIRELELPNTLSSIGYRALCKCGGLKLLTIPFVGVTRGQTGTSNSIFGHLFGTALGEVSGTYQIYSSYADGMSVRRAVPETLETVIITDETMIPYGAFSGWDRLKSICINSGVYEIGPCAFDGCNSLTNITIPSSISTIGSFSFRGCSNLGCAMLPSEVGTLTVGGNAFDAATEVTIGDKDGYVFVGWTNSVGATVTDPFHRTKAITVTPVWKKIETATIDGRIWTYSVSDNGFATIGDGTTNAVVPAFMGDIAIPDEIGGHPVVGIGGYAFAGCREITSLTIASNVMSIGIGAFEGCTGLTNLIIESESLSCIVPGLMQAKFNTRFDTISMLDDASDAANVSGVIAAYQRVTASPWEFSDPLTGNVYAWNTSYSTMSYFGQMYMEQGNTYVFGSHFDDDTYIKVDGNIILSVKDIDTSNRQPDEIETHRQVFVGQYMCLTSGWHQVEFRLSDIDLGKGSWGEVWSAEFGVGYRDDGRTDTAQSEWSRLLDPGDGSLFRCDGMRTMFAGCSNLVSVTMPWSLVSRMSAMFPSAYDKLESITLTGDAVAIPEKAFAGCSSLRSLEIPDSVTKIGRRAFWGCYGATNALVIPASVNKLDDRAFGACSNLAKVVVSSDIGTISVGVGMFDANIPVEIATREGYAFCGWTNAVGAVIADPFHSGTANTVSPWWKKTVTVAFDANGGTGTMAEQLWLEGNNLTLAENSFVRAGYLFLGWAESANGTVAFADGATISGIDAAADGTVLYAVWKPCAPNLIPSESATFPNASQAVTVSCPAADATILYTTDGSDPAMNGNVYRGPFSVYESCRVRAIARKEELVDSDEASVTLTRAEGLSEAANLYGYLMETDGTHPWTVVSDVSHDGVSCVKSGAIGNGGMTWIQTSLKKAGMVSFWWRAACEEPDVEDGEDGYYDYGAFLVDGNVAARLAGNDTGWQFFSTNITSGGKHVLRWEYSKDGVTTYAPDCLWLDQVQWIPADGSGYTLTTPEPVPYAWLTGYGLGGGSDFETAAKGATGKRGGDGRALQVWQDYVAGTDPTNAASVFTAGIEIVGGVPQVTWSPNLNTNGVVRSYTIWGKESLTDAAWHSPTNAADRFFKVSVEMP